MGLPVGAAVPFFVSQVIFFSNKKVSKPQCDAPLWKKTHPDFLSFRRRAAGTLI